jgi:thioredoxin reductase
MHCLSALVLFGICATTLAQLNNSQYDVIIIGGAPLGLSAARGLSRVLRKVAVFDLGEHRKNPTRDMHDVNG